jgi:hypothetical protein
MVDWNSTLVDDGEVELSINFTDPLGLSQSKQYDNLMVKAWGYDSAAKLAIPP